MEHEEFTKRATALESKLNESYNTLTELLEDIQENCKESGIRFSTEQGDGLQDDVDGAFAVLNKSALKLKLMAVIADEGFNPWE